jgi:Flp pilus assembly CpaF family ATPase
MGGTGTGKTTFLNAYVNYLLGIQKTDCFRYRLIDESKLKKKKVEG